MPHSDFFIVSRAVSGDTIALEKLIILKIPFILWIIRSMIDCPEDVEDVSQEVSIRICQHIAALKRPEAFDSWLRTIVRRECIRFFAAKSQYDSVETISGWEDLFVETDMDCLPFGRMKSIELDSAFLSALEDMHEPIRTMLYMRYFKDMRCHEIAAFTGHTVGMVSVALHRAKEKLREKLRCCVIDP